MSRPRSARLHKEILDAALMLVAERGIEAASMDAIAERSGVSKATIYNHWPDKEALLLEAMAELHGLRERPAFDTGHTQADMVAVLAYQPPQDTLDLRARVMPHFIAYSARNRKFGCAWRHMAMEPPRQELRRLLSQAVEKGELPSGIDMDLTFALLLGPMLYNHIFLRANGDQVPDLAERVVETFWKAFKRTVM